MQQQPVSGLYGYLYGARLFREILRHAAYQSASYVGYNLRPGVGGYAYAAFHGTAHACGNLFYSVVFKRVGHEYAFLPSTSMRSP